MLALSRTLRAGARRRCRFAASWTGLARGAAFSSKVGTEGMSAPVEQRELALGRGRLAVIGIKRSLLLQQNAGNIEESVGDAANGTAMGVAALA